MTNEEKRIKIAEACGLDSKNICDCTFAVTSDGSCCLECRGLIIPNYFSDLNACHEMEKTIWESSKWYEYVHQLDVEQQNGSQGWGHAPASQRAEAFGKIMNLW